MALTPGTRLGPYEMESLLGAGGMGEVYRARDIRLDRVVAVKVSGERFTERFEREARTVAALNHPRICTLYDVGPNFLVMELVGGPTLAERIAQRPLPLEEALAVARQIAEALEAAHAKGVIHRDLKPANVKFTPDGEVKVLDFGLAKMTEAAAEHGGDPANSPTLTIQETRAGMILGTASYMAPEQARGAVVDKRADIWAFGCTLYEMLTGRRLFSGASITDILAEVVRADPDWNALPAVTPAAIRRLLKRCLEKDRKRRLPDIGVALMEIDDAASEAASPGAPPTSPSRRSTVKFLAGAAAGVAAAGAGAVWQAWRTPAAEVWTGVQLGGPAHSYAPRLSPDGQLLAFLAFIDDLPQLGVMKPDGRSWTMLTHDRNSGYIATVAWARDGSKLYFDRYWGNPLGVYSVPPLGGEPRLLLENAYGPEPLPDGSLLVAKLTDQGDHQLFHYFPDSGKIEPLQAFLQNSDVSPLLRAFPDGKMIVYYGKEASARNQNPKMYLMDLASQKVRELAPGLNLDPNGSFAPLDVAPDGKSVYALATVGDSRLVMSLPRDGGSGRRALLSFPITAFPFYLDATPDGSLYLDPTNTNRVVLRFAEAGGGPEEIAVPGESFDAVACLPDGGLVTSVRAGGKNQLILWHSGADTRPLLESSEESAGPVAALPDSNVAFLLGSADRRTLAVASLRSGQVLHRFPPAAPDVGNIAGAPDGKTLYYAAGGFVWAQPLVGGMPRKITEAADAAVDPEGRYLFVKRSRKNALSIFRVPLGGGDELSLTVPGEYHLAENALAPTAVDARGRVLVTVLSSHDFYYRSAILDPAKQSFTPVPVTFAGDVAGSGWTRDGKIVARGLRYASSLWRYRSGKPPV